MPTLVARMRKTLSIVTVCQWRSNALWVFQVTYTPKIPVGCPTPQILVYVVTCNWIPSSVNLANTAVITHPRPICLPHNASKPFGQALAGPAWKTHSAPRAPIWLQGVGPRVRERRRKRTEKWKGMRKVHSGGEERSWGRAERRDEGEMDRGRKGGWTFPILRRGCTAAVGCHT